MVVGVVSAILLGAGALAWNFASDGGLVRLIGGVPEKDLSPQLSALHDRIKKLEDNPPGVISSFPEGAVVAFADECPAEQGWSVFKPATARFIIGAGNQFDPKHQQWLRKRSQGGEERQDLTPRALNSSDGEEFHILSYAEMPAHAHQVIDPGHDHSITLEKTNMGEFAGYFWTRRELSQGAERKNFQVGNSPTNIKIDEAGGGDPHNNMPPYIALYFCKKN